MVTKTLTTPMETSEVAHPITGETRGFKTFTAEKIIKGTDYIIGYIAEQELFSFTGITDFTGYHLAEGEEWDAVPVTAEQEQGQRILAIELGEPTPVTANSIHKDHQRGWATNAQVDSAYQKGLITLQQSEAIKNGTYVII